ncbi:MAG: hypothetical protein NVSMB33_08880 [Ktedonobacteraceae bacterium]
MTQSRDNAADNLSDVLDMVRLSRQNGVLSVERIHGGRFEEGEIFFQGGQPTYARTGQMVGQEALVWLLSWHQIYFTFLAGEARPSANTFATAITDRSASVAVNTLPSPYPRTNTSTSLSGIPARLPQVNRSNAINSDDVPYNVYSSPPAFPNTPGLEWLIPRKVENDLDVLTLPLTRPQRSIYLLVNGNRTISDLARCTRKSIQEIERLLSELQDRGLIAV